MKLLLDTHVLLWALLERALVVIGASAWEIATKWRLGTLQHSDDLVLASTDPAFT